MISWRVGEKRGVSVIDLAVRQIADAGAVLVHDRQALLALVLRAGFVDEDDARIEIALLAGQALVDGVGDDVGDAARVRLVGEELHADQLLAGKCVPQAELGAQTSVALLRDAAGDQRLRVDDLPVLEARCGVGVGDLLDERALVDRREQAGTLQIGRDDAGDLGAHWSLARKSVMAIGSGSILPLLTSISTSARAGKVAAALSPAASATAVNINRKNRFMR